MGKNKHKKNSHKDESKTTDSPKASDGGADQKGTLVEIHEKAASDSSTAASPVKDGSDSPGKLSSKAVKMQVCMLMMINENSSSFFILYSSLLFLRSLYDQ